MRPSPEEPVLRRSSRPRRHLNNDSDSESSKRRKITGGLRLRPIGSARQSMSPEVEDSDQAPVRRLQADNRKLPQRRTARDEPALRPSTLNKLVVGIWEQIFGSMSFDMSVVASEWRTTGFQPSRPLLSDNVHGEQQIQQHQMPDRTFSNMNLLCRRISQASRCS